MNIREKLQSLLFKLLHGIDSKLPDNWKYYTETGIGALLVLGSAGSLLLPPRSYTSGPVFMLIGRCTSPDIRFRILFKLDIRPPRYSVPVVLLIGFMIAGFFSPQTAGGLIGSTFDSDPELSVEERQPVKIVTGKADVRNNGAQPFNYTAGLSIDGELVEQETVLIGSKSSETFNISEEIQDEGDHRVRFYSSSSDELTGSNDTGFSIQDSVTLPNYLNGNNIGSSVQGYSPIPQKDLSIVKNVEISETDEGAEVVLTNKADNVYGVFDVIKTATANSFHSSKQIFEDFQDVSYVTVSTEVDYTYRNGTVREREILRTGLSETDAENLNWQSKPDQIRQDYGYWLNSTTSYEIEQNLCKGLQKNISCTG
jgi:hypothetical protein